jgi:uncharacterized membrane protein
MRLRERDWFAFAHDPLLSEERLTLFSRILSLRQFFQSSMVKQQRAVDFLSIPLIFFIFFLVTLSCGCLITPPFQTPDEPAHFLRIVQISEGHLVGQRSGGASGGPLLQSAVKLAKLPQNLAFNALQKASVPKIESFNAIGWGSPKVDAYFPNTVTYGPMFYLPSAISMFLTRHLAWSVLQSYYVARVLNAILFLFLGTATLAIAQRGKLLAVFLLSLPMTAALAGSLSQESLLIATSAILAALLTRHKASSPWSWFEWGMMGVGFSCLAMAKPPYLALSAIACCMGGRREFLPSLACPAVATAITVAWLKFGVAPVMVNFAPDPGVSGAAQISFVLSHPAEFLATVIHTLTLQWKVIAYTFIGVLGWLTALLPQYYYNLAKPIVDYAIAIGMMIGLLIEFVLKRPMSVFRFSGVLFLSLLSVLGIFFSLYVIWTPVAAPIVNGIQGRYFLPVAFFLMILMPDMRPFSGLPMRIAIHPLSLLMCVVWLSLSGFVFAQTLILRFWLL